MFHGAVVQQSNYNVQDTAEAVRLVWVNNVREGNFFLCTLGLVFCACMNLHIRKFILSSYYIMHWGLCVICLRVCGNFVLDSVDT